MKRIIWHWSAGLHTPSNLDREHYHFIIDGEGKVHPGKWPVAANEKPVKGQYAAHTLNCNTGSIGIAVAAMAGAVERPFDAGRFPITQKQVTALVELARDLGKQYGIPVTPETMLSHAEVQPVLGIKHRGKWDITWLPGMAIPGDPVAVGNKLRAMVKAPTAKPAAPQPMPKPVVAPETPVRARQSREDVPDFVPKITAPPAAYVAALLAASAVLWQWGAAIVDWLTFWN